MVRITTIYLVLLVLTLNAANASVAKSSPTVGTVQRSSSVIRKSRSYGSFLVSKNGLLAEVTAASAKSVPVLRIHNGSTVSAFILKNFLPLGFLSALVISLAFPAPGRYVGKLKYGDLKIVQVVNSFLVFLVSGLTLQSNELAAVLKRPFSVLYGFVTILLLTPLLALVTKNLPLNPPEFATGLSIFCLVPTTLSVGVALTQAAKGNQALALLLTVGTNILGIVTVPYLLKYLLGDTGGFAGLDAVDLISKMTLTVLLPTVIGQLAARSSAAVRDFVKRNRVPLSIFSTLNLISMVWQSLSTSRDSLLKQSLPNISAVIASGVAVHVIYLVLNYFAAKALGLPIKEAVAVLIMASQKSAPVAVTVISYITKDVTQQGLLCIPAIVGQLSQIFIGSFVAGKLAEAVEKNDEQAKTTSGKTA